MAEYKSILCYHCKFCFRDDYYGICCENKKSEHYTNDWDLPVDVIEDCEYFEEDDGDD